MFGSLMSTALSMIPALGNPQKSYVVAGAIVSCSYGTKMTRLHMPVSHGVFVKGKPQLSTADYQPYLNIQPFGKCLSIQNPVVASGTAANGDILKPVPCTPIVTMPWQGGKSDVLIENEPAMLNDCTNMCLYCGDLKIEDDGQDLA
ncbi:DUF4280 domain-containing protein [Paenibacillus agilis]|nr:DUF4280 domain-containing protein [Paenibacillus agilis]